MNRFALAVAVLILVIPALAQQEMETNFESRPHPPEKPQKPSAEQDNYGRKLLELAEGEAGALQGGMRAFANLRLARAYQTTDKKKALEFLDSAFAATRDIDDDTIDTRSRLQVDILKAMAPLDAPRAEDLLVQVEPAHRAEVLQSLLSYYQEKKQTKRAIDVVYRISSESEFPYGAAANLMASLPPAKSDELTQLFSTALASYRQHADGKRSRHPSQDLMVLVTKFSKQLPPELLKEAISEIIKQADPANRKDTSSRQISIASSAGAASFSNEYQYKLFELIPILRELDKDQAEQLMKKNQEAADWIAKFPGGMPSNSRMSMMSGAPVGGAHSAAMDAEARQFARMRKLLDNAETHPDEALANIATIDSKIQRAEGLIEIAQNTWKKNPSSSNSALKQFVELAPDLRPDEQTRLLSRAADIYFKMGATADAKRVVEKELEAAAGILKQDTNGDDPNKALKAYWPSTNAYSSALRTAGQIDPAWALTLLKDMPDSDIRFCSEIALASAWLHLPIGATQTVSATKKGVSMMIEDMY